MKCLRQVLFAPVLLLLTTQAFGQIARPDKGALPETIAVVDVLAIIGGAKLSGQGCGATTWNGEGWGFYMNMYKDPMKLPWNEEPQRVTAHFAYGRMPVQHHLIAFTGPGFRYERKTNEPYLTLVPAKEPE